MIGVLAALTAACAAWGDEAIELGPLYVDAVRGFSLRPPADTERKRLSSTTRLVSWMRRDPETRAIAWTLTMLHVPVVEPVTDLKAYGEGLARKLRVREKFLVESVRVITAAGKKAIDLRGAQSGRTRLWNRQVWILAEPNRFLILVISGPLGMSETLVKISQTVLETLKLSDPVAASAAKVENLKRGKALLASLTSKKLSAAVRAEPQWLLLRAKGEPVGFMKVVESFTRHQGSDGLEVRTWLLLRMPEMPQRLLTWVMFATADGKEERWSEFGRGDVGGISLEASVAGVKVGDRIRCTVREGKESKTRDRPVPKGIHLPHAIGMILPRLIDLTKQRSYAFATYASLANSFDLRTLTVFEPEKITLGSSTVEAIRLADQVATDQTPASLWVDEKGNLLRRTTADGLVTEPATHAAVLRRFPDADRIVRSMEK